MRVVVALCLLSVAQSARAPDDAQDARTPDGRIVRPSKTVLAAFNERDRNHDGYITREEFNKHWLDQNVVGWKTFGAAEYEESMKVANEEADPVFEYHDLNRDGKIDIADYMKEGKAEM